MVGKSRQKVIPGPMVLMRDASHVYKLDQKAAENQRKCDTRLVGARNAKRTKAERNKSGSNLPLGSRKCRHLPIRLGFARQPLRGAVPANIKREKSR
jgi:hypothetical protein